MIKFKQLSIPDVFLIEPQVFNDERGFFFESFNQSEFERAIGHKVTFVQDNHSRSSLGVLRGLHYQNKPHEQGKLVRVIKGEVLDVALDLRTDSKYFGKYVIELLSEKNNRQMWIPEGFAHGFLALSNNVDFVYKTTNFYNQKSELTIKWNDPGLNIDWPSDINIELSPKDRQGLSFEDFKRSVIKS